MVKSIKINCELYEELRKYPMFFLKFHEHIIYDGRGREKDCSEWVTVDRNLNIRFEADLFGDRALGYCLCIIERAEICVDNEGNVIPDIVEMFFHDATGYNPSDYRTTLSFYIARSNDIEDKYAFVEFLWLLDKHFISEDNLKKAISFYDERMVSYVLNKISCISHCLSVSKQKVVKEILSSYNYEYTVYKPGALYEIFDNKNMEPQIESENIFNVVDRIVGLDAIKSADDFEETISNRFLQLRKWLKDNEPLDDYSILVPLFSLVSEPIRFYIIKRYFHDIRLGNITFDTELLSQFKDNKYEEFIRYRYATETPAERIILTVPLLCDNILTLYNSRGQAFQTFNGVLDLAMTHCDHAHPGIDFRLQRFIPVCNGGAVYNEQFKGFVDYQLVRKLNETRMTESDLFSFISDTLDKIGNRETYPVCKYGDGSKIDEETFKKCSRVFSSKKSHLECYYLKKYENRWIIDSTETNISILKTFIFPEYIASNDSKISINSGMISVDILKKYLIKLPENYECFYNGEFAVPSYKYATYDLSLIERYSDILKMRFFPQKGARIGCSLDILGFMKDCCHPSTPEKLRIESPKQYQSIYELCVQKETEEIAKRTIISLKHELNIDDVDGCFELPYDKSKLVSIINKYYFKSTIQDNDDNSSREFLKTNYDLGNFKPYCAPRLSDANNPAIDIPYFWCRGKECFRNNLDKQTIKDIDDWHAYSIYHMIEIIGYPKLHYTTAGYEPDPVVWNFIAITNKAMQTFKRLKCRSCGHLMFTDRTSGYNRYNYYSCINPSCPESRKAVYLSYCFKCKKGLIDSRDSARCPNGWYICPTCLSCCDDEQYERQAQRYILSNRPVPERIKSMIGRGHNNNGQYYCPHCGSLVGGDASITYCPKCRTRFEEEL